MEHSKDHTIGVLYPGKLIANTYRLQARLGRSDLADVWLADKEQETWVIKLYLLPRPLNESEWETCHSQLIQVQELSSPLVQIPVDYGLIEGLPYVVLPYCQYGAAIQWTGKLSESELATFMYQGAKALYKLHQMDPPILHKNLHLNNFLIDQDLNYVLADVSISGALRRDNLNSDNLILQAYQAPETFSSKKYGRPADIFSFGVCLFQMATGTLPFGKEGGIRLINGGRLPDLPSHFSARINQIVQVCMARGPEGRPDAGTLLRLAERYLEEANWRSVPGFSFAVGRSPVASSIISRIVKRKPPKKESPPRPSKKLLPTAKWLIPASIALGIGITLYFINPLLNVELGQTNPSAESPQSGPVFAPSPEAEPIARYIPPKSDLTVPAPTGTKKAEVPPTHHAAVPETPASISSKRETKVVSAEVLSESTPVKEEPKRSSIATPEIRNLQKMIQQANELENQVSSLAFSSDKLSADDQSYLKQLNSELSLLARQVQRKVEFSAEGTVLGWKREEYNGGWLKQMQASIRQHQRNLKAMQSRLE